MTAPVPHIRLEGVRQIQMGIAAVKARLEHQTLPKIGHALLDAGIKSVRDLTPRNLNARKRTAVQPKMKRGYPPLYRQWRRKVTISSRLHWQGVIMNLADADPKGPGAAVLRSVEGGAQPHPIPKHGFTNMAWRVGSRTFGVERTSGISALVEEGLGRGEVVDEVTTVRSGARIVFRKRVRHPGMKGFFMVRDTRLLLDAIAQTVLVQEAEEIGRAFGRLTIGVGG